MIRRSLMLILLGMLVHTPVIAETVQVETWLKTTPLPVTTPAFADSAYTIENALARQPMELKEFRPGEGDILTWSPRVTARWSDHLGDPLLWRDTGAALTTAFACAYVNTSRWQSLTIKATATRPVMLFIDGEENASATEQNADSVYEISASFDAHTGQHTLLFQSASNADSEDDWSLSCAVDLEDEYTGTVSIDLDPAYAPAHYGDYARFEDLTQTQISPDGKYTAVLHTIRDAELKREVWLEVFESSSGKPVETIRMTSNIGSPQFLPKGRKLAFTTSDGGKTTLWTYDLTTKEMKKVLQDIEGFYRAEFSPDEDFVYYAFSDPPDDSESNYDFFEGLEDKLPTYDPHARLNVKALESGVVEELIQPGKYALQDWRLSQDGSQMLIVRRLPRSTRPYSEFEFWVMNIETRESELIDSRANIEFPQYSTWVSPTQVAYVLGSHDASPEDTVFHNASNTVLYLLDIEAKRSINLTGSESFTVDTRSHQSVFWNPRDKHIWMLALVGGERRIMKVSPDGGKAAEAIQTDYAFVDLPALSADGSMIAYIASDVDSPDALFVQSGRGRGEKKIFDPNAKLTNEWIMGGMQEWDFENEDGYNIDGWFYTPADFDPNEQWPLIVYYYGGVSPRDVRFVFTYHWWLANGYCVYVLNPVGSYGYGQEFADFHANDWGKYATRDVIEGTEKILDALPYLDRDRVGAYGGSYGGFVTLDLVTRTNMFAAAVDMYGISNITNYFGGGTWGHWYSDIASPGSFPWSDRDIYVDRSPVYNADKIETPLLILHGASDTNVPPVESDQMFVALKLLGQDVAYAKFKGETHNINVKFENLIEHREMMLEWFDKYLKERPEGWDARLKQHK